jgi:hypothetical protein
LNARRTENKQATGKKADVSAAQQTIADKPRPVPNRWQKLALAAATILLAAWLIVLIILARK